MHGAPDALRAARALFAFAACGWVLAMPGSGAGEYAPNLPISPDTDLFIHRLCARYGLPMPEFDLFQPFTAAAFGVVLDRADSLDKNGVLSAQESYHARQARDIALSRRSILKWESTRRDIRAYLHGSFHATVAASYADSAAVRMRGIISPLLSGNIGRLSYYSGVDVWTDYWSDTLFARSTYQPRDGVPYNLFGRADADNLRASDILRGGVRYSGSTVEIETGIDRLRLGPAVHYPLTLSGSAPPVTFVRMNLDIGRMRYGHALGLLKHQKDLPKHFYLHRLTIPFRQSTIVAGINEVIVNGSTTNENDTVGPDALRSDLHGQQRGWEWAYMIPFVPFKFAEHYIGDRDNGLISFDVVGVIPRDFRWYAEFLLDDISAPWTLFSDDWGNKWALTAGVQYFGRIVSRDVVFALEYSRVEPWVYSHFAGGSHQYTHFGMSLGSPMGPNSDALVTSALCEVARHSSLGVQFANSRSNRSVRGGSITDVFQGEWSDHPDSEKKTFLGEGTIRSSRIGLVYRLLPLGVLRLNGLVEYELAPRGAASLSVNGGLFF